LIALRLVPTTLLLALASAVPAHAAPADPTGWWLDESGRGGILIQACGDKLCGRLAWLKEPIDPKTGKPKIDDKNDDPGLKNRPLCGLTMLWDFSATDPGNWDGGRIYDPESGNTYKSVMALKPDGTLKVRGYIGISLFGRSQIWTRPAEPLSECSVG
jgi:uncharacterized protein (DUF2147 family)